MKTFKKFNEMLKEHALYSNDLSHFDDYFSEIKNSLKTFKNFDTEIKNLTNLLKNIKKEDIRIDDEKYDDDENYEIKFNININSLIFSIEEFYNAIRSENENLSNKIDLDYYNGNKFRLRFDIEIERNNFNKFHFPIDLPNFLKNIGLGKKIIFKSLDTFKYCLFTQQEDSTDLKIVINSITNSNDYFSFQKDMNIIIFTDDFNIIKNTLEDWFNIDYENYTLDKDFHFKYKEEIKNDSFLSKLYEKYENKN